MNPAAGEALLPARWHYQSPLLVGLSFESMGVTTQPGLLFFRPVSPEPPVTGVLATQDLGRYLFLGVRLATIHHRLTDCVSAFHAAVAEI